MIWESRYWKVELGRKADALARYAVQQHWPGRASARAERLAMTGFFEIRKLIDSRKLRTSLASKQIALHRLRSTGHPVTIYNRYSLEKLYNLESYEPTTKSLRFLCNQAIHSFVFILLHKQSGELSHLLFASDRERCAWAYQIGLRKVIAIFREVSRDLVATSHSAFNEARGDYDIVNS